MFKFLQKFRPQIDGKYVLALDIGTEFVKALIYRIENNRGWVIGYARVRQKLGDMSAGSVTDIAGVTANCEEAIRQAERQAGVHAEQTVIGIAGELVHGATTTISYTRENPQNRIDLAELKAIIQRVQKRAFDQVRAELARETGHREVDVKLVNAAIIDTKIDGVRLVNPLGFQGHEVQLSVFNAFAPLVHFGALQTIAAELELDLLTITPEPYAVARALTHEDGSSLSAIFIDVGGGTTDIAVVRSGSDLAMRMFAIGGRTFTKRLSQTFNVSFLEAERIKLEYAQNKLDKRSVGIVKKNITPDVEVWLSGVELALSEMITADLGQLPPKIYLCGGGAKLPEIKQALESVEWTRSLPFIRRPTVQFLVPDDIMTITDETGLIKTIQDVTPLALANLGLELAGEEKLLSIIMRKAVRLLQN